MYEFIVEDGTGLDNATSYVSVLEADDYAQFVGDEDWDELDEQDKEFNLMITTTFVDNLLRWNGVLLNLDQALNFPRTNLYDNQGRRLSGVPTAIKNAVMQLALKNPDELSYQVVRLREQVFGSASEKYLGSIVDGDDTVDRIRSMLASLGYGVIGTSFVTMQRA